VSLMWGCIFMSVLGSILFFFEQARVGGMGLTGE
jgi:hypothetical protein